MAGVSEFQEVKQAQYELPAFSAGFIKIMLAELRSLNEEGEAFE